MHKGATVLLSGVAVIAAVACSSGGNNVPYDAGPKSASTTVEDTNLMTCSGCTAATCASTAPLDACCTCVAQPASTLVRSTDLHRYSAPAGSSSVPDLSCLSTPTALGTPQMVTLTGYVWLFSTGEDSQGVKVQVFAETNPNTDGAIGSMPLGSYTTTMMDAVDPTNTTWDSECTGANGCSYRQYTIPNVPTETPLVIETTDGGQDQWATLYDYNIYFPNSSVVNNDAGTPTVSYDATAVASGDLGTVAGTVGLTVNSADGLLAGEVHDCGDDRVAGATVGITATPAAFSYFTSDESDPLPDLSATSTSDLGLFGGINIPLGKPVRVTAIGTCPSGQTTCTAGQPVMIGTYVVQLYAGAVTALSLRGRRPWQP
jgi:hypothetical protein